MTIAQLHREETSTVDVPSAMGSVGIDCERVRIGPYDRIVFRGCDSGIHNDSSASDELRTMAGKLLRAADLIDGIEGLSVTRIYPDHIFEIDCCDQDVILQVQNCADPDAAEEKAMAALRAIQSSH